MRTYLIILILFPTFLIAQKTSSIDLMVGIDYSHYYLNDDRASPNDLLIQNRWLKTRGNAAWRLGMNYSHRINLDNVIKFGVSYSNLKFESQSNFGFDEIEVYKLSFIEFPVVIRREMEVRRFSPFVEFGLAYTLNLKHSVGGRPPPVDPYKDNMPPIEFIAILACGFNYKLKGGDVAFVQPSFRYHLFGAEIKEGSKHNFYTIGLEFGVRNFLFD